MREVSYDRAVAHIHDTHWSHYGAFIYLKNLIALIPEKPDRTDQS